METEPGAAGMRRLAKYWMWYDYPAEEFMLAAFLRIDPEGFRQELLRPLAVRLWEKARRRTNRESARALLEELEPEKDRVRVVVSMFGRETPVDLELDQVEAVKD